jgi:4-hydroxybenzoate polyprenyltransferase
MSTFNKALFTHILLAIAALCLSLLSELLSGIKINQSFYPLVFFCTLFIYRLAWYGLPFKIKVIHKTDRILMLMSGIVILYTLCNVSQNIITGVTIALVACLAYFIRYKSWQGIRTFSYVKSIWLAAVWSIVTVWIPLLFNMEKDILLLLAERFLFMLAICIIYNLRDMQHDNQAGIMSMPERLGIPVTKTICIFILVLNGMLIYQHHYPVYINMSLSVSLVLTAFIILFARKNGHWMYFTLLIDGSMILQYLLVFFTVRNSVH